MLCIFTGESLVVVKIEADSNNITEHPHDDKPRPYVCTVCDKRFTRKYHLKRLKYILERSCIHVPNVTNV